MKYYLCTYHYHHSAVGPHLYAKAIVHYCRDQKLELFTITEDPDEKQTEQQFTVSSKYYWPFRKINYIWRSFRYHRAIPAASNETVRAIIYNNLFSAFVSAFFKRNNDLLIAISHDHYYTLNQSGKGLKETILLHTYRSLEKYCLKKCDYVLFCSDYTQQRMETYYRVYRPGHFFTLYPGIDLSAFTYKDPQEIKHTTAKVLFIKTNWEAGGLDLLIGALNQLKHIYFELTVAGPSPNEKDGVFSRYHPAKNVAVQFLGRVDHAQIPGLMVAADLFCLPSRKEALGITILEALASGTPVIASGVGGMAEALDHGRCGWISEKLSAEGIADTIRSCLSDHSLRTEKARLGRKHVEAFFSLERMYARIDELFSRFTS